MIPMIFWWLCNLQISLSAFRGTVLKNDWAFKASRSVCFDAGRGCLVIANLLGSPAHLIADGRMKANAWDVFFFPWKNGLLSPFQQSFWGFWGWKRSMNPGKRRGRANKKMIGGVHVLIPNHSLFRISNLLQFLTWMGFLLFMRKPNSSRLGLTSHFPLKHDFIRGRALWEFCKQFLYLWFRIVKKRRPGKHHVSCVA